MESPRRILNKRGLAPQKGLGQNFLADPQAIKSIIEKAELSLETPVLEIGPGLGALTEPMLEAGFRVTAVELDRGLADYLEEELAPRFPDRLRVHRGDAIKTDLIEALGETPMQVIGNLPYQISSPFLFKMLAVKEHIIKATLMFQKEFADRLSAGPGAKDYSRLSVLIGYYAQTEQIATLNPQCFFPRPKVSSTVVKITFRENPSPAVVSFEMLRQVVAAAFSRRRKTLANSLQSVFDKSQALKMLELAGIDPGRRAETLSIAEFVAMANSASSIL